MLLTSSSNFWHGCENIEALDEKEDGLQVEYRTRMGHTYLLLDLCIGFSNT